MGSTSNHRVAERRAKIALADANWDILQHATHLLESEFDVISAVRDGESILHDCERMRPDVVILDISLGKLSGLEVARRLRDMGHQAKIVFLTVHEEAEFVCAAFGAGGAAYVAKSRLNSDLADAVRASLAGRIFLSPSLQHA